MLPALIHAWGAPLGEPIADDFGFLHRALLERGGSWLDGASGPYWRPLSRQLYFGPLGALIVAHPWVGAALHVVLLAATGLLLHRALRARLGGPAAAAAASFPLLMESTRMLIAWPSHFQEIGALFFAALAVHEASRARLATMLLALLGALLSKETGVVAVLAALWAMPATRAGERPAAGRGAWWIAALAVVVVWAGVYAALVAGHRVLLPAGDAALPASWPARLGWAVWNSLRASVSLSSAPGPWDGVIGLVAAAFGLAVAARFAFSARARARLVASRGVIAWGLAWFLVATMTLVPTHPGWWPNRAVIGAVGLGGAITAIALAADPRVLAALVAARVFAFAVSPSAPRIVTGEPVEAGNAFDFTRLVRLQRLAHDARLVLRDRFPALPPGARVGQHNLPLLSEYAFAGDKALQVWYRDSTLRRVRFEAYRAGDSSGVVALIEWQPRGARQVALVETGAMAALLRGMEARNRPMPEVLAELARADALQRDRSAGVFLGTVASKRALALLGGDALDAAAQAAREGLAYWPENPDSYFALGIVSQRRGAPATAIAQLDSLLARYPDDAGARQLRDQLAGARPGP